MTLGEYLRAARSVRSLTLAEVGARVGVTRSMVCDVEKGYRRVTLGAAEAWAVALELGLADIVERVLQAELDAAGLRYRVKVKP